MGKWMYNTGSEEHWRCDEGEFENKEQAIEAGRKYFTEPDGYLDCEGEEFNGSSFDVGLISNVDIKLKAWSAIDEALEQAGEQVGELAEHWLEKLSKEDEKLLSEMLSKAFWEWVKLTKNEPQFFTMTKVETVNLDINEN